MPGGSLQVIPGEALKAVPEGPNAAAILPEIKPILQPGSGTGTGAPQSLTPSNNLSDAPGAAGGGTGRSPGVKGAQGLEKNVKSIQESLGTDRIERGWREADKPFSGDKDKDSKAVTASDERAFQEGGGIWVLPEVSEELPGQEGLSKARDPPYVEDKKALFTVALSIFGIAQPDPKALESLAWVARKVALLNRENTETDQYHGFSHQLGPASVVNLFLRTLRAGNLRGEKASGILEGIERPAGMSDQTFKSLVAEAILFAAMAGVAHDAEGVEVVVAKSDGGRSYIPIKPELDRDPSKPEGKISLDKLAGMKPVAKLYEDGQGASFLYPKIPNSRSHLGKALELIAGRGPEAPGYLAKAEHPFVKYVMFLGTAFSDEEKAILGRHESRWLAQMQGLYGEDSAFMLALAKRLAAHLRGADMLQAYAQHRGVILRSFKLQREFRDKGVVLHGAVGFLDKVVAPGEVYRDFYRRLARTAEEDPRQSREGYLRAALYLRILAEKDLVPKNLHELLERYGEERLGSALEPRLTALEAALEREPRVKALLEKTKNWLDLPLDRAMEKIMGRVAKMETPLKDFINLEALGGALRSIAITQESLLIAMGVAR